MSKPQEIAKPLPTFGLKLKQPTVQEPKESPPAPPAEKSTEPAQPPKASPPSRKQVKRRERDEARSKTKAQVSAWIPEELKLDIESKLFEEKRRTGKKKTLTGLIIELLEDYSKN